MIVIGYDRPSHISGNRVKTFSEYQNYIQLGYGRELKKGRTVFLSHKSEDKNACLKIAQYLDEHGIDVYLDIFDEYARTANIIGDREAVVECIKRGVKLSDYMLCVISKKTKKSKWVPFEIGYGHACIVDVNRKADANKLTEPAPRIAILTLEDISEDDLPDYLKIVPDIRGGVTIRRYIGQIKNNSAIGQLMSQVLLYEDITHNGYKIYNRHPLLKGVLNLEN